MSRRHGLVALVCIAALLAAAMAPVAADSYCATLALLDPLFVAVVSAPVERVGQRHAPTLTASVPLPSRAPPTA